MRRHAVQDACEVRELLRDAVASSCLDRSQVVDERLHAVEAGLVEWFEDVERGEEERAEPQVGSRTVTLLDRVPEGAEQVRAFAVLDHVLGELADVEIERDEIVDLADFAADAVSS